MTDGPFRNANLSGRWKRFGDDLVSDASSASERSAQASHSMLGDMDWSTVSPLLRDLTALFEDRQLDLDAVARASAIFGKHPKTPFLESLRRHVAASLREGNYGSDAIAQALNRSVRDWTGMARSRIEEECIRARDTGDMTWDNYRKGVARAREAFDGIECGQIARALLAGDRRAFSQATTRAVGVDEGPEWSRASPMRHSGSRASTSSKRASRHV